MDSTLQVRIDAGTKKKAQKVFKKMGLDMSSGVKLYLSHIVNTGSLPFVPQSPNRFSKEQEQDLLREFDDTKKRGKIYGDIRALHDDILR